MRGTGDWPRATLAPGATRQPGWMISRLYRRHWLSAAMALTAISERRWASLWKLCPGSRSNRASTTTGPSGPLLSRATSTVVVAVGMCWCGQVVRKVEQRRADARATKSEGLAALTTVAMDNVRRRFTIGSPSRVKIRTPSKLRRGFTLTAVPSVSRASAVTGFPGRRYLRQPTLRLPRSARYAPIQ